MFVTTDRSYNSTAGKAISTKIYHQLASAVQLGYQIISEDNINPEIVAISILDAQIAAPLAPQSSLHDSMIAVQLDDNPPLQFNVADKNFSFGARVYKTLYIPFGAI